MGQTRKVVEANIATAKSQLANFEGTLKDKSKAKRSPQWRLLNGEVKKHERRLKAIEKYAARDAELKAAKEAKST